MFERFLENLGFQCLLAEQTVKLANLVLQGSVIRRRRNFFATARRSQTALRHQAAPREQLVRSNAMPARYQAHRHARLEGLLDQTFSDAVQRRRRWTDVMISTRSVVLVIDTIVCLTLYKWETVSGPFGGYLICSRTTRIGGMALWG